MTSENPAPCRPPAASAFFPAAPLWSLAPTRTRDGDCLADFMMLIPGLGRQPAACQAQVALAIREVCEGYGEQVAFVDINYAINVLWVSVAAQPGLAGRVAQAIRERVPEALLVGGQLQGGFALAMSGRDGGLRALWRRFSRRAALLLGAPDD